MQPALKICPFMNATAGATANSTVVGSDGAPAAQSLVNCIGAQCAMYVPIRDGDGKQLGGECSVAMLPSALMSLGNGLCQTLLHLSKEKN